MMKRFLLFLIFPIYIFSNGIKYLENYIPTSNVNIQFTEDYYEYTFPFEHYVFTKKLSYIRKSPNSKSKILKKVSSNKNIEVLALVENNKNKWYEVKIDKLIGYIPYKNVLKREFKFLVAINEANVINQFLLDNIDNLKVVHAYKALNTESGNKKDVFGNSSNQSILAYTQDKSKHFNLQDRTILSVASEEKKGYNIKVQNYPDLFLSKKYKNNILNFELDDKGVQKYIFIDRNNQNLFAFEKNNETGIYTVLRTALVTTGKNGKYGFETPFGNFLVAISKPLMAYTSDIDTTQIIGDARYATRFTGGAYIHGIPSLYEPKETRNARKSITESKLGTYPLSHKCVRIKDGVAKYIYTWLGAKKVNKAGHRTPVEPVIVIVR